MRDRNEVQELARRVGQLEVQLEATMALVRDLIGSLSFALADADTHPPTPPSRVIQP